MNITQMLDDLQAERTRLDELIVAAQRYAAGATRRRGRPPAWLSSVIDKPRRGRPPGSRNKPKSVSAAAD